MTKRSTKEQILEEALELFSIKGFEATSISQIADAVGIRKASLYSHFSNKQDILDTLIEEILQQYHQHSLFEGADWEDENFVRDKLKMTDMDWVKMIQWQVRYILHDPMISKARKMLMIEQFQTPVLAKLQTKQNYEDIMQYNIGLIRCLIRHGILKEEDPEAMAAALCLPVSVWINLCDREPEREEEIMHRIEKHVLLFFKTYRK